MMVRIMQMRYYKDYLSAICRPLFCGTSGSYRLESGSYSANLSFVSKCRCNVIKNDGKFSNID